MRNKRRHGIDEPCRSRLDRVQSNHAGFDSSVDFRDAGRLELNFHCNKTNHLDEKKKAFPSRSFFPPSV